MNRKMRTDDIRMGVLRDMNNNGFTGTLQEAMSISLIIAESIIKLLEEQPNE